MTLTMGRGPLARPAPDTVNYRLDSPERRLFFDPFPRRVRAELDGRTVLDTRQGMLLHETGVLPQLYVPAEDVRQDLLEASEHTTHCPYKGDATYESVRVGDRVAENAVWTYRSPLPDADWLRGYRAFYWDRMDAWFDEAEQVFGHLRDPYHRVDTRPSTLQVRVTLAGRLLAASDRPVLLSETGLPNRLYLPPEDVQSDALTPTETASVCPYKGTADYAGVDGTADVAWRYQEPLPDTTTIAGFWCFDDTVVDVQVSGS